jgi:hypothetical protein
MIEVFKVAIGGCMAFPIAYLLLLWFFNQDPFNLAPTIGRILPFAVPAELRDQPATIVVPELEPETIVQDIGPVMLPLDDDDPLAIPDLDPDKNDDAGLGE